ncbi:MAG: flagellar biosynthesis protein FlhB [Planctomycetota bacterium]
MEDDGDKTEEPTERRRREQREKGNVAKSRDLSAAGLMLGVAAVLWLSSTPFVTGLSEYVASSLANAQTTLPAEFVASFGRQTIERSAFIALPVMGVLFVVSAAVALGQVGFLAAPQVLSPKLNRLDPIKGAQKILSVRALATLGTSLAKLAVLTLVAAAMTWWELPSLLALSDAEAIGLFGGIRDAVARLATVLAVALLVVAFADYAFQRWKYNQEIRMTKQEVRDELKSMEGDPLVRQRRRDAHRKLAEARDLTAVREADVVVTNPTHYSVALRYRPDESPAPKVVAKGTDEIALRIRAIAAEHDVPIVERPPLARQLYRDVKVGRTIPTDLYEALVEVMAYVYRLKGERPR